MEQNRSLILLFFSLSLLACNGKTNTEKRSFDCNSLADKKTIYTIAKSIIDNHDNDQIWNLSEVDTTDFFTIEGNFINSKTKNRLVLMNGTAGMSSGTADNLLILFS